MQLDSQVWMPHLQFILQTMSIMYPTYPNDVSKKKYYDVINNLPVFFPIKPMGETFTKLLDEFPVTPYLKSRESFMRWVHFINNKLNIFMEWEQTTFYDSLETYYASYKPKELIRLEHHKRRKQYIQISVIIFIIISIVYFLKNE